MFIDSINIERRIVITCLKEDPNAEIVPPLDTVSDTATRRRFCPEMKVKRWVPRTIDEWHASYRRNSRPSRGALVPRRRGALKNLCSKAVFYPWAPSAPQPLCTSAILTVLTF